MGFERNLGGESLDFLSSARGLLSVEDPRMHGRWNAAHVNR